MKKLLKEYYKSLLKEEIDYSSKTATVYHLTGFKTAEYDSIYKSKMNKTKKDLKDEIEAKYAGKKKTRAQSILSNIKYKAALKDLDKFKTPKGQAYYIANSIRNNTYDLGSHFSPGKGAMYAEGLYTCYNLNPEIARTYGSVILRFEVKLNNFFIFNAGIAKGIYGDNFRLQDQFLEICKNKGVDLRGFYNQEVSLDISTDAIDALSNFIQMLTQMSERPDFLNSDINTNTRTAPMALHALKYYSRQFHNGMSGILRDVIDGVIFYGLNDGPVCVIYHPSVAKNYTFTGSGYFDEDGNPVIEYVPEKLVDRSGTSLKDTFNFAQELNFEEIEEYEAKRSENLKQKLSSFGIDKASLDADFIEKFPAQFYNIIDPLNIIYNSASEDLIISRVKDTQPEFDNYCRDLSEAFKYIQFICSILAEPFFQFIDTFGPGLGIVSKDEFKKYCYMFKQYASYLKHYGNDHPPKLADFELNGLKCSAQNEEEFTRLVEQHLETLTDRYYKMLDEGLAEEFVYKIYDDIIGSGGDGAINNSIAKFEIGEVKLNTSNDALALEESIKDQSPVINDIEQKLIDLFDNENLRTPQGIQFLNSTFQYHEIVNVEKEGFVNGTLNFGKIAEEFGYYSDYCNGGGDIFYTLHEQVGKNDTGASAYAVDRDTFDPEFILQKMYNVKPGYALKDAAGLSLQMFKEGRKAFSVARSISFDFVKSKVMDDKIGNLSWVVENMFDLPTRRDKIFI